MKNNAKYLVASEETEGNNGWPYTPLLTSKSIKKMERALRQRLNITPEELAKKMVASAGVDQASLPTMAAIDLSKMDLVAKASDNFANAILTTDASHIRLTALIKKTQSFDGLLKDQYHFAQLVLEDETITDKNLKETAREVMEAINTAVIAEQHSPDYPNAHGLTADITSWGGIEFGYEKQKFRRDNKWAEAMNRIHGADKPQPYPGEKNSDSFPIFCDKMSKHKES